MRKVMFLFECLMQMIHCHVYKIGNHCFEKKLYSGFVKKTVTFGESLSLLSYVLGESCVLY